MWRLDLCLGILYLHKVFLTKPILCKQWIANNFSQQSGAKEICCYVCIFSLKVIIQVESELNESNVAALNAKCDSWDKKNYILACCLFKSPFRSYY